MTALHRLSRVAAGVTLSMICFASCLSAVQGQCTMDCAGGTAVESQWAEVLNLATDLTPGQRLSLTQLGWTQAAWDECFLCYKNHWTQEGMSVAECVEAEYVGTRRNIHCPDTEIKLFDELSDLQQVAAQSLGYTKDTWDATSPYSCCFESPLVPGSLRMVG